MYLTWRTWLHTECGTMESSVRIIRTWWIGFGDFDYARGCRESCLCVASRQNGTHSSLTVRAGADAQTSIYRLQKLSFFITQC